MEEMGHSSQDIYKSEFDEEQQIGTSMQDETLLNVTKFDPDLDRTSLSEGAWSHTGNPWRHKTIYKYKRVHYCNICSYTTNRMFNLMRHVQSKHSFRKFVCDHCSLVFDSHRTFQHHCEIIHGALGSQAVTSAEGNL